MSTNQPRLICGDNLSYLWGRVFLHALNSKNGSAGPLTISLGGFQDGLPREDARIREALDDELAVRGKYRSAASAMVIFPYKSWWRRGEPHCEEFSSWYLEKMLPRLKARARANQYGTYFQRMIAFQGVKRVESKLEIVTVNQLLFMINEWNKERVRPRRPRQSALQVACLDPAKDHTGQPVRGFPCLQQISFTYDDESGLAVNAYYPSQFVFDRGYGNYLGLCYLGTFMARELGLEMVRLNCFVAHLTIGNRVSKSGVSGLVKLLRELLPDEERWTGPDLRGANSLAPLREEVRSSVVLE